MVKIKACTMILSFLAIIPAIHAGDTDAGIAEWFNMVPSAPHAGQNCLFTASISSEYRNKGILAFFRSHDDAFSMMLQDNGENGDEKENDRIFSRLLQWKSKSGLWYCLIGAGDNENDMKYDIPQAFMVTEKPTEYRGIWADSWNKGFLTKEQTIQMVKTIREANLNAIIAEVRKTGDAYYDSAYEPRATNLPDPDYDPLKHLVELAHDTSGGQKRIEVHAWVVNYRIFKGDKKNPSFPPNHILGKHPEWASINSKGEKSDNGSYYLDPGVPDVMDYNINVCLDIIRKYDVDGINFDYVRYPNPGWGYNPIALKRFRTLYKREDTPSPRDSQWLAFLRQQVTYFLRKAYVRMIAVKPRIKVSVCTIGWGDIPGGDFRKTDAHAGGIQDWAEWNRRHILDINCRMGYKRQHDTKQKIQFQNWSRFTLGNQCFRMSTIGIGSYLNTFSGTLEQIKTARMYGSNGFVLYSYNNPISGKASPETFFKNLRNEALPEWADVPPFAWKISNPNGILGGTVKKNGAIQDGMEISLPEINLKTTTDGTGFYAFLDVPPGKRRIDAGGKSAGNIEIKPGHITTFDVHLP
ncbi:family 10 glycosylhydrolase [Candidatus Sumerlaeota bacterium]|nr:family 10 glycosylhydrolase [Candidatus Sumerlaeota bacterium]